MSIDREELKRVFPVRLMHAMESAKLTQSALARQLDVDPDVISRWVSGRKLPSAASVANLADALGTTSDYLLGR